MSVAVLKQGRSCQDLLNDMLDDINAVRGSKASGKKGLAQRFHQIASGSYANPNHIGEFLNRQSNLRSKIDTYRSLGCGEPPPEVTEWADKPLASVLPDSGGTNFSIPTWAAPAAGGAAACAILVPGCFEVELVGAPAF
jgi:hypothetical protein